MIEAKAPSSPDQDNHGDRKERRESTLYGGAGRTPPGTIQPGYPHGYPFGSCGDSRLSVVSADTLQHASRLLRLTEGVELSMLVYHTAQFPLMLGVGSFLEIRETE